MGNASAPLMPPRPPNSTSLHNDQGPAQTNNSDRSRRGLRQESRTPLSTQSNPVQKYEKVKNPINLRRESLKLSPGTGDDWSKIFVECIVDSTEIFDITVYYYVSEFKENASSTKFIPHYVDCNVDRYLFKFGPFRMQPGLQQQYSQKDVGLGGYRIRDVIVTQGIEISPDEKEIHDIVLHLEVLDKNNKGSNNIISQTTYAQLRKSTQQSPNSTSVPIARYSIRCIKQKLLNGTGKTFVVSDIYGMKGADEQDNMSNPGCGAEFADCVICLTEKREIAVLPCRHMCLCQNCAKDCFPSQGNKCPICRNPVQALLRLTEADLR